MDNSTDQLTIAMYWDFENIHASICDAELGKGGYKKNRFAPQERLVDVHALVEFASSLGTIAINRAYCNWQWFGKYQDVLLQRAIELVQLFHPGASAKNGADIKLCLDVTEDIIRFPHIKTIVIIGGDSDFIPVSQKVKAAGKTLVGVGCRGSTNKHWAKSCHEFRYYETLLIDDPSIEEERIPEQITSESSVQVVHEEKNPDAGELIKRAVLRLSANKGDSWVVKAAIRPMIKRLDPTFEEATYGARTFPELLNRYPQIFEMRQGEHDHEVRIREEYLTSPRSLK